MAVVGAAALVGQTVLVRELMVSFYGTELALASVLCCWLLFIPVGALLGALALKGLRRGEPLVYVALAGIGVGLVIEFLLARLVRPLLGAETGEFLALGSMLVGAGAAALPMAFWIGFFFPVAAHIEEARNRGAAVGISRIYVAEAVGSAAAGVLLSLYLLSRLDPSAIIFAMAFVVFFCGAWYGAGARAWAGGVAVLILLLCAAAARRQPLLFFAPGLLAGVGWWAYLAARAR